MNRKIKFLIGATLNSVVTGVVGGLLGASTKQIVFISICGMLTGVLIEKAFKET